MKYLNTDCLVGIFEALPVSVLLTTCRAVCREWRDTVSLMTRVGFFRGKNAEAAARRFALKCAKSNTLDLDDVAFLRYLEDQETLTPGISRAYADLFPRRFQRVWRVAPQRNLALLRLCTCISCLEISPTAVVDGGPEDLLRLVPNLKCLIIDGNSITNLEMFSKNTSLVHLHIKNCASLVSVAAVAQFTKLKTFRFSFRQDADCPLAAPYFWHKLSGLEHFEVAGHNGLSAGDTLGLGACRRLSYVDLSFCSRLTTFGLRFVRKLSYLRYLDVSYTRIESVCVLASCAQLEEFYADGTPLVNPVPLSYCKKLVVLSVLNCVSLDYSSIHSFWGACPRVKIYC